jgi:23S rRNA-/tRNA-specific pseudouridylate synthase
VPKSHVYSIVRSGQVRVNGRRTEVSYRLQSGDMLRIPPMRIASVEQEVVAGAELKVQLPVVYEDEGLLVVDKPAGIAVHGGSGESFGVIEALRRQRPQARFLELAHRLDRETSGILLLGKKRSALLALHEMFRAGAAARRSAAPTSAIWSWSPVAGWIRCACSATLAQVSAGLGRASGPRRRRGQGGAYVSSGCWRAGSASVFSKPS